MQPGPPLTTREKNTMAAVNGDNGVTNPSQIGMRIAIGIITGAFLAGGGGLVHTVLGHAELLAALKVHIETQKLQLDRMDGNIDRLTNKIDKLLDNKEAR